MKEIKELLKQFEDYICSICQYPCGMVGDIHPECEMHEYMEKIEGLFEGRAGEQNG